MWQRFTERARRIILSAQEEARQMNSGEVATEHLLLGVLREDEGTASRALDYFDVSRNELRAAIAAATPAPSPSAGGEPKLAPKAKRILELGADEARRLRHNYVGTEHLLLALLRQSDSMASQLLREQGLELDRLRLYVQEYAGAQQPPTAAAAGSSTANFNVTPELQRMLSLANIYVQASGQDMISFVDLVATALVPYDHEVSTSNAAIAEQIAALKAHKEAAVRNEDYELASTLRDKIRELTGQLQCAQDEEGAEYWRNRRRPQDTNLRTASFVTGILQNAAMEAQRLGNSHTMPLHLFLAMLTAADNDISTLLASCGLDNEVVLTRLREHLAQAGKDDDAEAQPGDGPET